MKEKVKRLEDSELTLYRWIRAIGGAGVLAAATSSALNAPGTLTAISATVALAGFILYSVRSGPLEECRAFLDKGSGDLAEWGRWNLRPSEEPVPPALWKDYVERIHAIRAHPSCLKLRK